MENGKVFRTKSGYCHVLPDKIVLTRNGVIGDLSKIVVGNSIGRIMVIYGLLAILSLYYAYAAYRKMEMLMVCIYGLCAYLLAWGILRSRNNSATPVIERSAIKQVKLHGAMTGMTRAYFEILFEEPNGKIKKRLVLLPGSMSDGKTETEKAVAIMKEEGLLG